MTNNNLSESISLRDDLSPFLVHLTDNKESFSKIMNVKKIKCHPDEDHPKLPQQVYELIFGDNKYFNGAAKGPCQYSHKNEIIPPNFFEHYKYMKAISLTETPLHNLKFMEKINLKKNGENEYGIVFLKDTLKNNYQLSPIFNFYNNKKNTIKFKDTLDPECVPKVIMEFLWYYATKGIKQDDNIKLESKEELQKELLKFLALIVPFGDKISDSQSSSRHYDYYWNREWRCFNDIKLVWDINNEENEPVSVFCFICPRDEQKNFSERTGITDIPFVDVKDFINEEDQFITILTSYLAKKNQHNLKNKDKTSEEILNERELMVKDLEKLMNSKMSEIENSLKSLLDQTSYNSFNYNTLFKDYEIFLIKSFSQQNKNLTILKPYLTKRILEILLFIMQNDSLKDYKDLEEWLTLPYHTLPMDVLKNHLETFYGRSVKTNIYPYKY